jgi:PKD repeat protein
LLNRYRVTVAILSLVLAIGSSASLARTFWVATNGSNTSVGSEAFPFATIKYAVGRTSLAQIDTILVKPGVYHDSISFSSIPVVVRSVKGAKATTIDGSGFNIPVVFESGVVSTTVLDGFTIRGGALSGIAVLGTIIPSSFFVITSSPEIKNCIIRKNGGPSSSAGAGIYLHYSRANVHNNIIDTNTAGAGGGGIYCSKSAPKIWNNLIQANRVEDGSGGGLRIDDTLSSPVTILVQNNLIIGNYAYANGGGAYLYSSGVVFANNLVYGNSSASFAYAGGVMMDYGTPMLLNNIIAENTPYGTYCTSGGTFLGNCFYDNPPSTQKYAFCTIDASNFDEIAPQFVDSAGGDFHLQSTSTIINAGSPLPPGTISVDYDGFPRQDGVIDVGPFERTSCSLSPNFTAPSGTCAGQPIAFTNQSTGHYIMSIWDYGNSVVDSFPNVDITAAPIAPMITYEAGGNYTVRVSLICPYSAKVTAQKTVQIVDRPDPQFQPDVNQGCAPLTVKFTNTSAGIGRTDVWYFGDGMTSSDTNPTHIYVDPGDFAVKLVSTSICGRDSVLDTISVQSAPRASFTAESFVGSPVLSVTFTGNATNNPTGWLWTFGDGGTANTQAAVHDYEEPGVYDVSLTATNACGAGPTEVRRGLVTVYGFELTAISFDTTNRLQQRFSAVIDTLYGLFARNINLSASVDPTPARGTANVTLNRSSANALDSVTATINLSRDVPAHPAYRLRLIGQSVSNRPVDTLFWQFHSRPDTLIKLSVRSLAFDSVQLDTFAVDSIRVSNTATLLNPFLLNVLKVQSTDSQFVPLDSISGPIQPNGFFYVRVRFKPADLGAASGFLTITSDDPALPALMIVMSAIAIPERKPPFVASTKPDSGTSGVLIGTAVALNMSELIDASSVTNGSVVLRSRKLRADLLSSVRLDGQIRLTVIPQQRFLGYDTIDVRLLATVRDRAGNTLDSDHDGKGDGSPVDDYRFWFATGPAVYPGDCNNDGVVNEFDVLPLGMFYGMTGPRRDSLGEETGWGPKQAVEWSDRRATYADADGNGLIDADDLLIIALNWLGSQPQSSPLYAADFDFRPYASGLEQLRNAVSESATTECGQRIAALLNRYSGNAPTPRQFSLSQNRPNPFNPVTEIEYALAEGGLVNLSVYNILGQKVKVIVDSYQDAGFFHVVWDGTDDLEREVSSGVYFYRLTAGDYSQIRKMIKLR